MSAIWAVAWALAATCEPGGGLRFDLDGIAVLAQGDRLTLPEDLGPEPVFVPVPWFDGVDAEGKPLSVVREGEQWILRRGDERTSVPVPWLLKSVTSVSVSWVAPERLWFATAEWLVSLELSGAKVALQHLGRVERPLVVLTTLAAPLVTVGTDVWRCERADRCVRERRSRAPILDAVRNGRQVLAAVGGPEAGLWRLSLTSPYPTQRLTRGTVKRLCGTADASWALLDRDGQWRLVLASPEQAATSEWDEDEVLAWAFAETPFPSRESFLALLMRAQHRPVAWSQPFVTRALKDPSPQIRTAAARVVAQHLELEQVAALWLLSHDAEPEVRNATLQALMLHCEQAHRPVCLQAAPWFLADTDVDTAWTARDWLLELAPAQALRGASVVFRRAAVAKLAAALETAQDSLAKAGLRLLAQDSDTEVRESATLVLDHLGP